MVELMNSSPSSPVGAGPTVMFTDDGKFINKKLDVNIVDNDGDESSLPSDFLRRVFASIQSVLHLMQDSESHDRTKTMNILLLGFSSDVVQEKVTALASALHIPVELVPITSHESLSCLRQPSSTVRIVSVEDAVAYNALVQSCAMNDAAFFDVVVLFNTIHSHALSYDTINKRLTIVSCALCPGGVLFMSAPYVKVEKLDLPQGSAYETHSMGELAIEYTYLTHHMVVQSLCPCTECSSVCLSSWTDVAVVDASKCRFTIADDHKALMCPTIRPALFSSLVQTVVTSSTFAIVQFSVTKPACPHTVEPSITSSFDGLMQRIRSSEVVEWARCGRASRPSNSAQSRSPSPNFYYYSAEQQQALASTPSFNNLSSASTHAAELSASGMHSPLANAGAILDTSPLGRIRSSPSSVSLASLAYSEDVRNSLTESKIEYVPHEPRMRVYVSGISLGLPNAAFPNARGEGKSRSVFDRNNIMDLFKGKSFLSYYTPEASQRVLAKNPFSLVKNRDGSRSKKYFELPSEILKVHSRIEDFDLNEEYGVPSFVIEALDITFQLAIAAGLEALLDAGFPILSYTEQNGRKIPKINPLPPHMTAETGVIFASSFPGLDSLVDEVTRASADETRTQLLSLLAKYPEMSEFVESTQKTSGPKYEYNRKLLFQVLVMANSQLAELIHATGPNTQCNAACAGTSQAIALGEDWIRHQRCDRVIVISADTATSERLNSYISTGFMCLGAATNVAVMTDAACPFDVRRKGMIVGAGSVGLVLESGAAVNRRRKGQFKTSYPVEPERAPATEELDWTAPEDWRPRSELLLSHVGNSAYHASLIHGPHVEQDMKAFFKELYQIYGSRMSQEWSNKNGYCTVAPNGGVTSPSSASTSPMPFEEFMQEMSSKLIYYSHETGTASCAKVEVKALKGTFTQNTHENVIVCNTKGFTGHPMSVNIEDVMSVASLHYGLVPPIANLQNMDPALAPLQLSAGGTHNRSYSLRFAAGFGSQFVMLLFGKYQESVDDVEYDIVRVPKCRADAVTAAHHYPYTSSISLPISASLSVASSVSSSASASLRRHTTTSGLYPPFSRRPSVNVPTIPSPQTFALPIMTPTAGTNTNTPHTPITTPITTSANSSASINISSNSGIPFSHGASTLSNISPILCSTTNSPLLNNNPTYPGSSHTGTPSAYTPSTHASVTTSTASHTLPPLPYTHGSATSGRSFKFDTSPGVSQHRHINRTSPYLHGHSTLSTSSFLPGPYSGGVSTSEPPLYGAVYAAHTPITTPTATPIPATSNPTTALPTDTDLGTDSDVDPPVDLGIELPQRPRDPQHRNTSINIARLPANSCVWVSRTGEVVGYSAPTIPQNASNTASTIPGNNNSIHDIPDDIIPDDIIPESSFIHQQSLARALSVNQLASVTRKHETGTQDKVKTMGMCGGDSDASEEETRLANSSSDIATQRVQIALPTMQYK